MFFSLIIKGRTPQELRENAKLQLQQFVGEDEKITTTDNGQMGFAELTTHRAPIDVDKAVETMYPVVEKPVEKVDNQPALPLSHQEVTAKAPYFGPPPINTASIPTAPQDGSSESDDRGVPWHPQFHASSKEKTRLGQWRKRRGVEDKDLDAYESQFKPAQPAPFVPQLVPTQPVSSPQVVQAPIAPPTPIKPPFTTAHSFATFKATLPDTLLGLVNSGKLTKSYIDQLKAHYGVDQIYKVNDEQLLQLFDMFCEHGFIQKVG